MDMENTSEHLRRKQRSMWSIEGEELLLVLWEQNVESLRANRKHFYIITKMAVKMAQMGYPHTAYEIKIKIHNITSRYREERRRIADSGLPSTWPLYDSVHKILGAYHDDQQSSNRQDIVETAHSDVNNCRITHLEDYSSHHNENSQDEAYDDHLNEDSYMYNVEEEAAKTNEHGDAKRKERKYLRSINRNLEILLDKMNEVSEHSQAMEKQRNATLQQLLRVFKRNSGTLRNSGHTSGNRIKRLKLSTTDVNPHVDHDYESFSECIVEDDPLGNESEININADGSEQHVNDDAVSPVKESTCLLTNRMLVDMKLKEEYLKTKQQEREFMTEKHYLQMEILKMELEAKRKRISKS